MCVVCAFWPLQNTAMTYAVIGFTFLVLQIAIYRLARHPVVLRERLFWAVAISVFSWAVSGR